jgi:LPXTG-motif cell wall-anchored protein
LEEIMNRTMRTLSRTAGMALALSGAALFVAGQASANDRAVVVSCTDQSAGTWTLAVTFSSIEVKVDRPVQVTLGSDTTTLTEPGANGTVTLSHTFGADQPSASMTWSIVRLDYQNMGVLRLDRPAGCGETTPSTEAPPTTPAPPSTEAAPTTPSTEAAPTTVPATVLAETVTPAPSVQSGSLPQTGRPTLPLVAVGAGAVIGGLGLVGATRRRTEKA